MMQTSPQASYEHVSPSISVSLSTSPEVTETLKQRVCTTALNPVHTTCADPIFFRLENDKDRTTLTQLLSLRGDCLVLDSMQSQLRDLVKLENPTQKLTEEEYQQKINDKLNGRTMEEYGVWVYYPWKNMLCHLLDEKEFIQVRTIRNLYKITKEEQELLQTKKIGIVGLSAGHAVTLTLAMERGCGELRLVDFDHLELTNMNRLRASVHEIGLSKAVITKREIAEIDPYLKVTFFNEPLSHENIAKFIGSGENQLDLIVDECDNFPVKVLLRKECRQLGIPVVMEASDRGLLDVERFDLDRNYPILHGRVKEEFLDLKEFTPEQAKKLLFSFLDPLEASERGLESFLEIGKSITTWPQLASDVILGGSVCAMAARMVLLNHGIKSQRTYVDVPNIINPTTFNIVKKGMLLAKCFAKSLK
ncbi:hypothetical protein C9374_004641 [Naegleria lovaniensis]|uniref:THIF-type NAD/FAD binding fold domain-containing protein n=1 Tax=Naegleria lovaniensis TaxID=51637 RepID=A0AA88GQH7_NAELO|nr:uncharacterized protein C9374_004641 [Naegleria lovaniensis]KAG2383304.1 hypothetical protein C9374_004641 [Naegleria lovaniensis]